MRKIAITFCLILPLFTYAQNGDKVFSFLELPFSSHVAALGGENISIVENDITLSVHNPALLSYITDKTLNFNYMSYLDGTNAGGAAFGRLLGKRSSWAVTAQYVDYGKEKQTNEEGIEQGTFSMKDMALAGIYTYDLGERWSGGVKANFIYSHYDKYSSFAIGVDLGLNYYREESNFSFGAVVRNLGGQIVAFHERHERLPVNVQLGISKTLSHAPFRFSLTLDNLNDWKGSIDKKPLNHVVLGVDFIPANIFYLSLGYNLKRAEEMKVNGSSHWAGIAAGAGIQIKRIKLGAAYAKYHTAASSLLFNLTITL